MAKELARRIAVRDSGAAAAPGGYANSGVHIGDVNLLTGAVVRTRYRQQVRRIAPPHLRDRDAELARLAEFCTSAATAGTYAWWRARAWSGKSALMSWFVLHPPAGVRIVSFFVTSRLASQNDRAAFIDNVLEQLLALLGEALPPFLTDSTREAHLLALMAEAAEACQLRREHFVLLVDGLDEDRGVHDGPDSHSIAALLPTDPPAGMRVIVAGRPNPPIPADVSPHHPLRDHSIVRVLAPSPHAEARRDEMARELKRLSRGTVLEQDLLGLVAAGGGGFSAADLAELTASSRWQVDEHLRTVTGRSFAVRDSHFQPGGPEVYLLGHEELRVTAVEMLGPSRLAGYRDRVHAWAQRYREQGWPVGTPEYLLRGYFRLLQESGDVDRMLACATDLARHDRMLDLSGGDVAALSEITTTQDVVAAQEHPDLIAMVRLAVHRDHLHDRNSHLPTDLPAVWISLGQLRRAAALARSITDPHSRIWTLLAVAAALSAAGHQDRAIEALTDAAAVSDAGGRDIWLARVVDAMVEIGELGRAERLARSIDDPHEHCGALTSVVAALVRAGDSARAAEVVAHAEAVARTAAAPGETAEDPRRNSALTSVAEALFEVGEHRRAAALLTEAEARARPHDGYAVWRLWVRLGEYDRAEASARRVTEEAFAGPDDRGVVPELAAVAGAMAESGAFDRAEGLARGITDPETRNDAQRSIATALVAAGDFARAEPLARALTNRFDKCQVLSTLATAMAAAGERDRATAVIDHVERTIPSIGRPYSRGLALTSAARASFAAGAFDRASTLIDQAEAHAMADRDPALLTSIAKVLVDAAEQHRATTVLVRAESVARTLRWDHQEKDKVVSVARALAEAGQFDRAEAVIRTLDSEYAQGQALVSVAAAMAKAGEFDRAEAVARAVSGREPLVAAAVAMAEAGEFVRAEALADTLFVVNERVVVLTSVVAALLAAGRRERATELAVPLAADVARVGDADTAQMLLRTLVAAAEFDSAEAVARELARRLGTQHWYTELARMTAENGAFERAEAQARTIPGASGQCAALAAVAGIMARAGKCVRAAEMIGEAEAMVRPTTESHKPDRALPPDAALTPAGALARDGAVAADGSLVLDGALVPDAALVSDGVLVPDGPLASGRALVELARALAELGEFDRAEATAAGIASAYVRGNAFTSVARALAEAGEFDRAEARARLGTSSNERGAAAVAVVEGMVRARAFDRAETFARSIAHPYDQAQALRALATSDAPRRASSAARMLVLRRWYDALGVVVRLEPGVLDTVLRELDTLTPLPATADTIG